MAGKNTLKNGIILHGTEDTSEDYYGLPDSPSNLGWYPVAQWELTKRGILTQTPEMPEPLTREKNYNDWAEVISQYKINAETLLIGHSDGGGFWLKYLSLNPQIKIGQLILVAPSIAVADNPTFFAGFELDKNLPGRCRFGMDLFFSARDAGIAPSVNKIKKTYGNKTRIHQIDERGHFGWGRNGRNFPELLEAIK